MTDVDTSPAKQADRVLRGMAAAMVALLAGAGIFGVGLVDLPVAWVDAALANPGWPWLMAVPAVALVAAVVILVGTPIASLSRRRIHVATACAIGASAAFSVFIGLDAQSDRLLEDRIEAKYGVTIDVPGDRDDREADWTINDYDVVCDTTRLMDNPRDPVMRCIPPRDDYVELDKALGTQGDGPSAGAASTPTEPTDALGALITAPQN